MYVQGQEEMQKLDSPGVAAEDARGTIETTALPYTISSANTPRLRCCQWLPRSCLFIGYINFRQAGSD
jgi:hypothetical protein